MDKYEFTLRTDMQELNGKQIGRYDAFFPEADMNDQLVSKYDIPEYVIIENAVFKTSFNGGNGSVFVSSKELSESTKQNPRKIQPVGTTKKKYFWYKLGQDKSQKIAFRGFMLAIVGALIDTSFAIGKIHAFFTISYQASMALLIVAFILKILGLWLVFKKGFWESK
jgi:hypothetical protein